MARVIFFVDCTLRMRRRRIRSWPPAIPTRPLAARRDTRLAAARERCELDKRARGSTSRARRASFGLQGLVRLGNACGFGVGGGGVGAAGTVGAARLKGGLALGHRGLERRFRGQLAALADLGEQARVARVEEAEQLSLEPAHVLS